MFLGEMVTGAQEHFTQAESYEVCASRICVFVLQFCDDMKFQYVMLKSYDFFHVHWLWCGACVSVIFVYNRANVFVLVFTIYTRNVHAARACSNHVWSTAGFLCATQILYYGRPNGPPMQARMKNIWCNKPRVFLVLYTFGHRTLPLIIITLRFKFFE